MNKHRTTIGVVLSVAWVAIAVVIYWGSEHPTKANEWGDFLAGMCAPLAFLWLVLGYLQQGEELKHSTEALRLQADELKQSVEQQTALVAIERDMFAHELEKSQAKEREALFADTPRPAIQGIGMTTGGARVYRVFHVNMMNFGGEMLSVTIAPEANDVWQGKEYAVWGAKESVTMDVVMPSESLRVYLKATTAMGRDVFFETELFLDAKSRAGWRRWSEIGADAFLDGIVPI